MVNEPYASGLETCVTKALVNGAEFNRFQILGIP